MRGPDDFPGAWLDGRDHPAEDAAVRPASAALVAVTTFLLIAGGASAEPLAAMPVQTGALANRTVLVKRTLRTESVATKKDQPAKVQIVGTAKDQIEAGSGAGGTATKPEIKVEAEKPTLAISPGAQVVIRKSAPAAIVPLSTTKSALPGLVFVGLTDQESRTVAKQLRTVHRGAAPPAALGCSGRSVRHHAVRRGRCSSHGWDPPPALRSGIIFQLTGRFIDRIEPSRISVQVPGPTGYQQVKLITKDFAHAIEISAHSDVGDASFSGDIDPGRIHRHRHLERPHRRPRHRRGNHQRASARIQRCTFSDDRSAQHRSEDHRGTAQPHACRHPAQQLAGGSDS